MSKNSHHFRCIPYQNLTAVELNGTDAKVIQLSDFQRLLQKNFLLKKTSPTEKSRLNTMGAHGHALCRAILASRPGHVVAVWAWTRGLGLHLHPYTRNGHPRMPNELRIVRPHVQMDIQRIHDDARPVICNGCPRHMSQWAANVLHLDGHASTLHASWVSRPAQDGHAFRKSVT